MNQNKSNGLEPKKNGVKLSKMQKDYKSILDTLRLNALHNPIMDKSQASNNHQLLKLSGAFFFQLGVAVGFESISIGEYDFEKYPFWYSEILLIKQKDGIYKPVLLNQAILFESRLILVNKIQEVLRESLPEHGILTMEDMKATSYGYQLKRPLTLAEFQKLTPKAKQFSDYKEEK